VVYRLGREWWRVNPDGEPQLLLIQEGSLSFNSGATVALQGERGSEMITIFPLPSSGQGIIGLPLDGRLMGGVDTFRWLDDQTAVLTVTQESPSPEGLFTQGTRGRVALLHLSTNDITFLEPEISIHAQPEVVATSRILVFDLDGQLFLWHDGDLQPLEISTDDDSAVPDSITRPVLSPDGTKLAGVVTDDFGTHTFAYAVFDLTQPSNRILHTFLPIPTDAVQPHVLRWSPNGQWLALEAPSWEAEETGVWLASVDGQTKIHLGVETGNPLWLDDRRLILAVKEEVVVRYELYDVETAARERLVVPETPKNIPSAPYPAPEGTVPETAARIIQVIPNPDNAFACTGVTQIPQGECQALVAFFHSTNGIRWAARTNWLITDSPCGWYGVSCRDGHVTGLNFHANNLVGNLAPELGNLSQLEQLVLSFNELTGPIPPEMGKLSRLQLFDAHVPLRGGLEGTIPTELSQLTALRVLDLSGNRLSGPIPTELGHLANLEKLDLGSNQLDGPIPATLGELRQLTYLSLCSNQLTGTIPAELASLTNLLVLELSVNQLSDPFPPELAALSALQSLSLSTNQFKGPIPSAIGSLTNLQDLNLNTNEFSGPIPPEIGNLTELRWFDLSGNQLSGSLPAELQRLDKLGEMDIGDNPLSGPVPVELSEMSALWYVDAQGTSLCRPGGANFSEAWHDLYGCPP
jgi:Leucine-rich repeat (LRR) protein